MADLREGLYCKCVADKWEITAEKLWANSSAGKRGLQIESK
jgi:hypothetical protein